MDDAVGVDIEGHLDLRDAAGSWRKTDQFKAAQGFVVRRHLALALKYMDVHAGLRIARRRENLRLTGRNRCIALDKFGEYATQCLDPEAQWGHVQQKDVLDVTG